MKISYRKQLLSVLILSGAIFISGSAFAVGKFPMEAKLKQCETAFNLAHSGKLTQLQAAKERKKHMTLMMDILTNMNKRNAAANKVLSDQEVLNNFRVMGRLLIMLAKDHPAPTDEWGYPLQ